MQKSQVLTRATIVAGAEATHGVQPRKVAFDYPAMTAEPFLRLDPAARNARRDATRATSTPALRIIISLVRVRLPGSMAWSTTSAHAQRRNRIQHVFEELAVIHVRRREPDGERNARGIDHKMALAARSALIRRVRADNVAPLFAAIVELSIATRLQSISPAQPSSCNNNRWSRCHTPRLVQVRNRRQHVEPDPHPISKGRSCHGRAVRSTNRIPVRACRLVTVDRRPPRRPGRGSRGSNGSAFAHSPSLTRGFIPHGRLQSQL